MVVDILIIYAAADAVPYIPDNVYRLIQAFFNHFNAIPNSGLGLFWTIGYTEDFKPKIIAIQNNLLIKLTKHKNLKTEDARQTKMIIAKLCLMIYTSSKYHDAIHSYSNGIQMRQDFVINVLEAFFLFFQNGFAQFDLYDDHFIQLLYNFFYLKQILPNEPDIQLVLPYVITDIHLLFINFLVN